MSSVSSPRRSIALLLRDLRATFGMKPVFYCGLIMAQGVVESLAVASIMPLLTLVGMKAGAGNDLISRLLAFVDITPDLTSVSIFLWGGLFVSACLFLAQAWLGTFMQAAYTSIWRGRVADALAASHYSRTRKHGTGILLNALTYESLRCGDVIYQINLVTTAILHCCATLAVACLLSPIVTITMMVLGAGLFLMSRRYLRQAYILGQRFSRDNEALSGAADEVIKALKYLKATGTETAGLSHIHRLRHSLQDIARTMTFDVQKAKAVFDFGGATIFATLLIAMPFYTGVEVTAIITILALFVRLLPRLVGLQQGLQMMNVTIPAIETMHTLYNDLRGEKNLLPPCGGAVTRSVTEGGENSNLGAEPPSASLHSAAPPQGGSQHGIPTEIAQGALPVHLNAVAVKIEDKPILQGISGDVQRGQWLTIVGTSGAGKSTLLDVICGLIHPNSGEVTFAGHGWAELESTAFRHRLGLVEQDSVIFAGTIAENLCMGLEGITETDMRAALDQAGLTSFHNLQELVGGTYRSISGGEKQRLAIARALLRQPGLLILDEATSALDPKTEQDILETLHSLKGQFTIIMTTHRPAATQYADEIWLMKNGQLMERGKYTELENANGLFTNWLYTARTEMSQ